MPVGIERAGASGLGTVIETKLFKCPMNLPGKGWKLQVLGGVELPEMCPWVSSTHSVR